jgi:hypothetical protein
MTARWLASWRYRLMKIAAAITTIFAVVIGILLFSLWFLGTLALARDPDGRYAQGDPVMHA